MDTRTEPTPCSDPTPPLPTSSTRSPSPPSPTATRPRLPAWARAVVPGVLFLPAASAGLILMLVPGFASLMEGRGLTPILAFTVYAAVVLAAYVLISWALVRWVDRRPFRSLGLRPGRRALVALLAGYGIAQVIALLVQGPAHVLGIGRSIPPEELAAQMAGVSLLTVVAVSLVRSFLLQGIGEEVLFRGYLLQTLRRRPVLAVLIAAVVFTIPHLASSGGQQDAVERLLYLAIPFGFAISAGFLAIALRSVWAAVGIHGGFHLAMAVTMLLELTADGPAVWLMFGLAHTVVGVVVAVLIPRRRWDEVREHGPYGS